MARAYASFVLRCWQLDGDGQRITVEHIQSGDRAVVASVAAAVEWICAHEGATSREPPAPAGQAQAAHGTEAAGGAEG